MAKKLARLKRKRRCSSAQDVKVSSARVEKENLEPRAEQLHSTPCSPTTLSTNPSAFGGGLVSSPVLCSNTVTGDVHIVLNKIDGGVTQKTQLAISEGISGGRLAQEDLDDQDTCSKSGLRTPKGVQRKQKAFCRTGGKALRSPKVRASLNFNSAKRPLDRQGNEQYRECVNTPGGRGLTSLTGEITGTRVTGSYRCDECRSEISSFKAKTFRVKCTKCQHHWKCAKLRCKCTAKITIELSDRSKRTVVLSDPLLRSIVSFETEGHCNTDRVEDRVLKVGFIRVDYVDGVPERVERITVDCVDA